MASDWRETKLGDVAEFISGGTPSKARPDYWGGTIPWVSAREMKRFVLEDTEDHVTEEGIASGTRLVEAGTVLLLTRGMTLLNDIPISVAGRLMTFNQDVKAVRPKPGLREEFLPYLLIGNKGRLLNMVDLAGHGTGRLNTDELKTLTIRLPPESLQLAIATVLRNLDETINANLQASATLEALAETLFRAWFVNFQPLRVNGDRPAEVPSSIDSLFPNSFYDSPIGPIPEGWEITSLDEVAEFRNGLVLQKFPPTDGRDLPVIKIAQLRAGSTKGADAASADIPSE